MAVTTWTLTGDLASYTGDDWPTTGTAACEAYLTAYNADGPADYYVDTASGGRVHFGPTIPIAVASDGTFSESGIPDSSETGLSYVLTFAYRPAGHGRKKVTSLPVFTINANTALNQAGFVNPDFSSAVLLANATDAIVSAIVADEDSLTNMAVEAEIAEALAAWTEPARITVDPLPGLLYDANAFNGVPFSQDNVTTDGDTQYAVWVDDSLHPIIGKRALPHGDWSTYDLHNVTGNPLNSPTTLDGHNNYVVAVDSAGYVHVTGNHHDNAIRYVRSTTPGGITAWETATMVGDSYEATVTYPSFVRMPDDELLCFWRCGPSGNGAVIINAYDTTTQTWARRSRPLSGLAADGASPDESPYVNHIAVSTAGVLHLFYVWRTTSDLATTHDIGHMKSADNGATFTTMAGAALTLPVVPATTAPLVITGAHPTLQVVNQSGACVDSSGNPHAIWWSVDPSYYAQLRHIYYDGADWQDVAVIQWGHYVAPLDMARPSLVAAAGRVMCIYSPDIDEARRFYMRDITPGATSTLPEFTLIDSDLGAYEPSYDTRAAAERGELHMLVTPVQPDSGGSGVTPLDAYTARWGGILSLSLTYLPAVAEVSAPKPAAEKVVVSPVVMLSSAGSPTLNAGTLGVPAWHLDTSATEVIGAAVDIPDYWQSMDVVLWWSNSSSGSGDVAWQLRYANRAVGSAISGGETTANLVVTAPAQGVLAKSTIVSGIFPLPGSTYLFRFNFRRNVADAADTLANDAALIAVEFVRAS